MNDFTSIKQIVLPYSLIENVYSSLRKAGLAGHECVALWAGRVDGDAFQVRTSIVPEQIGYRLEEGLLYSVDGEELHKINLWLYENQMTLMLQVHSHPSEAYHSDTDDRYPIVAQTGSISIVIPNFGFDSPSLEDWAVYRLHENREWLNLSHEQVHKLFKIIDA